MIWQDLPVECRAQAADTLCYEAYCRIKDPVYGCAGWVSVLHQQLNVAEFQLATIKAEVAAIYQQPDHQSFNLFCCREIDQGKL